MGKKANDYIKVMDMPKKYKRSKLKIKEEGGKIRVDIEANDPVALIASLSSMIKQMRVISSVNAIE